MSGIAELEGTWAARVRDNREQVERCGEIGEVLDFYAPSAPRFVDDPHRTDDPVLDTLLRLAEPADTWLDIGAGGGRFALPLAFAVRDVIAVEPSPAMRDALAAGIAAHRIANIRIVDARWPMDPPPSADVALIAHVGYDVEAIGPFLAAMEAAAARTCVAVMMDRSPASLAAPLWPPVHGEERVPLPAFHELVELLAARDRQIATTWIPRPSRRWEDHDGVLEWLRGQLWIAPGGAADARLRDAVERLALRDADGAIVLPDGPTGTGVVAWTKDAVAGDHRLP
jgi:SAM-dependent methyltransferase